jgi:hypothetical protein
LKKAWAKKRELAVVHTPTALPTPHKVSIPQGVRDMDSIVQRFDRLDRVGQQFLIGQLTKMFCTKYAGEI